MGPKHALMLALFISTLLLLFQTTSILDELDFHEYLGKLADEPLSLTPYIEAGDLEEGREKATVVHVDMGDVKSYSGFFTVNKKYNSNIFFWFFPAKIDSEHAPVLLWLQGTPGVTSLFGLFTENGPFFIREYKNVKFLGPNPRPNRREFSWHINHNLIYMDNTVGTGFSFTENNLGIASNSTTVGHDLYLALVQFFTLFPMTKNEFYIAGESHAGKYIPALSKIIKDNNPEATVKINLQGLAIGSGLIDPYHQMNYSEYLYQIGLVDFNGREEFERLENKTRQFIEQEDWKQAYDAMNQLVDGVGVASLFQNLTGFNFNCNYLNTSESNSSSWYVDYVQRPDVRKALHVGEVVFDDENDLVIEGLKLDVPKSTTAYYLPELLEHYRVLIYNGQFDIFMTSTLTANFLRNLAWTGAEEYKKVGRKQWWIGDELAGYAKTVRNLTEVLVRNAGRRIGTDQPKWAWNLISRFTHRQPF